MLVLSPSEAIYPLLQQFVVCFELINFLLQPPDLVRGLGEGGEERGLRGEKGKEGGKEGREDGQKRMG